MYMCISIYIYVCFSFDALADIRVTSLCLRPAPTLVSTQVRLFSFGFGRACHMSCVTPSSVVHWHAN